jgi:glycosyltransferase involved in cell wall biosynthesis
MAKISFIIPCYNSENLLTECFRTLSLQTCKDVEFIFVDDGSTDETKAVLDKFICCEPRAKIISQMNKGLTKARLTGLKNASADLIAFLDSDDFIDTTVAAEAISLFHADSQVDAVLYNFGYWKNKTLSFFNYSMNFPITGVDVLRYTIPSWRIATNGVFRREHALKAYAAIDFEAINSDEVANRLVFESCRQVVKMNSVYYYVQRDDSISKKPSIGYISRLNSAFWLRGYSISKLSDYIPRKDADIHYINELCDLMVKFNSLKKLMEVPTKIVWLGELLKHRQLVLKIYMCSILNNPLNSFFNFKLLKKVMYVFIWPVMGHR